MLTDENLTMRALAALHDENVAAFHQKREAIVARAVAEAVQRGWAWLDEHLGRSWPKSMDLENFNLGAGCACVLGQTIAHVAEVEQLIPIRSTLLAGTKDPDFDASEVTLETGWTLVTGNNFSGHDSALRTYLVQKDMILTNHEAENLGFNSGYQFVAEEDLAAIATIGQSSVSVGITELEPEWRRTIGVWQQAYVDAGGVLTPVRHPNVDELNMADWLEEFPQARLEVLEEA